MNEQAPIAANPHDGALSRAAHAASMAEYHKDGLRLADAIGNRGPVRFGPDGKLHPDILAAYWKHGYYVFEGVIDAAEVEELRRDVGVMVERAPVAPDATVDAQGRPALGLDYANLPYRLAKPLEDPWGGTDVLGGRHQTQMAQPEADQGAPEYVPFLMYSMCQAMPAGLRVYGHPHLLAIAESINGADFVPYNDAIFVKQPGLGASVSWHQDGVTHWDAPDWDEGSHGFNFQIQLYPTTPGNCLWIVPGTHKTGRVDIKRVVSGNACGDRLPGAIPLVCQPGDVTMVNRQMVHGSFANSSPDLRISITMGFHRRKSVLGAKAALGVEEQGVIYDAKRIDERSAVIAVAIDARRQYYPDETAYTYQPFIGREDEYRFNDETFDAVIRDYSTKDLAI